MNTLKDLERLAREARDEKERADAEARRIEEQRAAASVELSRQAVTYYLVDLYGLDSFELAPLVTACHEYKPHWEEYAHIDVPGADQRVTFFYELRPDDAGVLRVRPGRQSPFMVQGDTKRHYATLGDAMVAAREQQAALDAYLASEEADDLNYEKIKALEEKAENEKDERVAILRAAIDQYPILLPLFQTIATCVREKADIEAELAAAKEDEDEF